jgi:hypothetical protein
MIDTSCRLLEPIPLVYVLFDEGFAGVALKSGSDLL